MAKILIIEDDEMMADMLADCLRSMQHMVETARDGASGLERLRNFKYELVVLDWQLPEMSGLEICKQFKSEVPNVPVIMLTSRSAITDKEAGFEAGVDDYVTKPINPLDFSARVRALLRRSTISQEPQLGIGDLRLDVKSGQLKKGARSIQLPPREAELMQLLMKQPGEYFSTEALLKRLWGTDGTRASLANCMKRLRDKLSELDEEGLVETTSGLGYRIRK